MALIEIADWQNGHNFSVGAATGGVFFNLFAWRIIKKITNAITKKSKIAWRNMPYAILVEPILIESKEKSIFPRRRPKIGVIMSLTRELTIFPNAAPMITPTAKSRTLPFMANCLNSFNMFVQLIT